MTRTSADAVTTDAPAAMVAAEVPDPVVALALLTAWFACGLLMARVMASRGHEFRAVAGIGAALGPLFVPLALDHLRHRDPLTRPVALEGQLAEGRRTVIVLDGEPERAADVLPVLHRLDDPGAVTVAVPVGYSTLRAPEHDRDRRAAAARARSAALLLHDYQAVPVLAPGTTSDVVEHLVHDDDLVLAVGSFPAGARASADRLGANVVAVPADGSR